MRLIVVIACIIVAATAVAQEDPCVAELRALPGRVRQPGNLGERLRLSLGLPEQGVLVRWRARRPAGEEGAIETTSETVYFDGGAVAMLGSEDAQETKVRKRPEASFTRGVPPVNTRARRFFFP